MPNVTIYTVGHGTRTIEELVGILKDAEIARLVDVRRYPGSRRNPHFARVAMEKWVPEHHIVYDWRGDTLGGRRDKTDATATGSRHTSLRHDAFRAYADHMDTEEFRSATRRLEDDATREPVAIMCAETLWWKCHRRMISDALHARGDEVIHLVKPGQRDAHKPIEEMRIGEDGWPIYDLGPMKLLD